MPDKHSVSSWNLWECCLVYNDICIRALEYFPARSKGVYESTKEILCGYCISTQVPVVSLIGSVLNFRAQLTAERENPDLCKSYISKDFFMEFFRSNLRLQAVHLYSVVCFNIEAIRQKGSTDHFDFQRIFLSFFFLIDSYSGVLTIFDSIAI